MANKPHLSGRRLVGTILGYGIPLGLLLVALQAARYRLLVLDHAQELYIGLIALFFTAVGIWAGRHFTAGKKSGVAKTGEGPLTGAALETALARLSITKREYEVLQLIAQGLSNQEIADRMFVSLNTIKTHTSNLFAKLDAQRRTQAVRNAQALHLLGPTHPKV